MEKLKSLKRFQKSVMLFLIAMALVFAVIYSLTISKVGFEYKNTIFIPDQKNGFTVYSGKIQGKQAYFTVSEDKTVVFQCGDKTYGPYTAKEDPSAVPENQEIAAYMTGVELRQREEIMFRGGGIWEIFQIRDARHAEPSDWEIAGRYIGWIALSIAAFIIFIMGLQ